MMGSVPLAVKVLVASGLDAAIDSVEKMVREMGDLASFEKEAQAATCARARKWFVCEMAKVMAEKFDSGELLDILTFLETDAGKKFVQFQLGDEVEGLLQRLVNKIAEGDSELWKEGS